jgi:hypothetical protein
MRQYQLEMMFQFGHGFVHDESPTRVAIEPPFANPLLG